MFKKIMCVSSGVTSLTQSISSVVNQVEKQETAINKLSQKLDDATRSIKSQSRVKKLKDCHNSIIKPEVHEPTSPISSHISKLRT